MSMTPVARAAIDTMMAGIARDMGVTDPRRVHNISPRIAQTIEEKVRQSNDFLGLINNIPVRESKGQILALGVPATITKRTATPNAAGYVRRPTDPTGFVAREYECFETEQDTIISWVKIDAWAHLPNFYDHYRTAVLFAMARDRLMIGWHGQQNAAQTNSATYAQLQDVNKGWLQYMIDTAPSHVAGLNPDGTVSPIKVDMEAADADFRSMNDLVYHLRYELLDRVYRNRSSLKVIMGDELRIHENTALLGSSAQNRATDRVAVELLLNNRTFGATDLQVSDEFPMRGVFVSELGNISRYWQESSMRRKIGEDEHELKGIVEYNFVREDYVMEAAEGCAMVHPDAIQIKDRAGNWTNAADKWAIA